MESQNQLFFFSLSSVHIPKLDLLHTESTVKDAISVVQVNMMLATVSYIVTNAT